MTGMDSEKSRDAPDVFRAAGMADGRIADYLCQRAASGRKESLLHQPGSTKAIVSHLYARADELKLLNTATQLLQRISAWSQRCKVIPGISDPRHPPPE